MFQYGMNGWLRRWCLFLLAFVTVSLAGGLVYGWPALRRNLRDAGGSALPEKTLGGIFTAGAWSTQGGRFLFGLARDRYGTKVTCVVALTCVVGGSVGVALSDPNGAAQLGVSMLLIGLGSGSQLALQPVASLFTRSGSVISTLSGAFQVSGLVFLALTSISDDRRHTFGGFAVVIAGFAILSAIMLPWGPSFVLEVKDEQSTSVEPASACSGKQPTCNDTEQSPKSPDELLFVDESSGEDAVEEGPFEERESKHREGSADSIEPDADQPDVKNSSSFENPCRRYKYIVNVEYIALVSWFSVCVVPLQYYVGSIGFQLEDKGDDDGKYTSIFSITYAAAAGFAPFGGYLADFCGLGVTQALATSLCATSMFVLASGASLDDQVAGLCAYGLGRMLVFGMFFTNVGKRFGFSNYGTLAGFGLLLSAIISLLQYPLIALAADGKARQVNVACGSVMVGLLPYCGWLGLRERRNKPNADARMAKPRTADDDGVGDYASESSSTLSQRLHFRASCFPQSQ